MVHGERQTPEPLSLVGVRRDDMVDAGMFAGIDGRTHEIVLRLGQHADR